MCPEAHRVAARLGFGETIIRRLEARGYLPRLGLTEPEIRERLYHGHLTYLRSQTGRRTKREGS